MSEQKETEQKGVVHIADEVVASIAALAATEVEGVGALVAGAGVDISELLGKKNLSKGVKIVIVDTNATIDIFLLVKYGFSVQTVAQKVQDSVSSTINSMTGLHTVAVNVHINGISFDKEAKKSDK